MLKDEKKVANGYEIEYNKFDVLPFLMAQLRVPKIQKE